MSAPLAVPDAERAVLCAAFLDNGLHAPHVVALIPPDAYANLAHQRLAEAIAAVVARGAACDPVTVAAELTARGTLDTVGGMEYVGALLDEVPTAANLSAWAAIITDAAARRTVQAEAAKLAAAADDPTVDATALRASVDRLTRTLAERATGAGFDPPTLDAFAAGAETGVQWVVPGYLARGAVTLVAGHPKVGKTTFAAALANVVARGRRILDRQAQIGSVLWIDLEQPKGLTRRRLEEACGLDAAVFVQHGEWPDLDRVAQWCRKDEIEAGLVVVDSLTKVWQHFGVQDENDPVQVERALQPLLRFAREANAALLILGHLRKSGGSQGLDLRGSGQIFAAVDIGVAFRRFTMEGDGPDQRRELEAFSRFEETPPKIVLDRVQEPSGAWTYHVLGSVEKVRRQAECGKVLSVLDGTPRDAEDIAKACDMAPQTARTVLKQLIEDGPGAGIERIGAGHRGDPFRYRRRAA